LLRFAAAALILTVCAFVSAQGFVFAEETPETTAGTILPGPGTYVVAAHPYYAHPVTGLMEDSGQNPGIGQGMTESVLGKEALLEVYENGDSYVTVRFALMDNIEDIRLSTQRDAQGDYEPAGFTVTKELSEDAESDLRIPIADMNTLIRAEFFVTAMGRDVVFFMTFTDPVPGAGDFVTTPEPPAGSAEEEAGADAGETDADANTDTEGSGGLKNKGGFIGAAAVVVVIAVIVAVFAGRGKKRGTRNTETPKPRKDEGR
jgi:hypothetical protein